RKRNLFTLLSGEVGVSLNFEMYNISKLICSRTLPTPAIRLRVAPAEQRWLPFCSLAGLSGQSVRFFENCSP
ncbi:MAG: hypothetical protein LUG19_13710, partial [Desulfovibrio sp.]|nr:hypothetical protein [Desulfovibrio sp.]